MGTGVRIARRLAAALLPGPGGVFVRLTETALRVYYGDRYSSAVFAAIHTLNGWGSLESLSGPGSTLANTDAVRRALPRLLTDVGAKSLLDAPCGDTHWISHVDLDGIDYLGVDVVPALVNSGTGPAGGGARQFLLADIRTDPLPLADVVLCRDGLVHLSNADALAALANIRRTGAGYLLATTFPGVAANVDIPTGRWRPMNLAQPPFNLPTPADLVVEHPGVPDADGSPKALGLWRLRDPPSD